MLFAWRLIWISQRPIRPRCACNHQITGLEFASLLHGVLALARTSKFTSLPPMVSNATLLFLDTLTFRDLRQRLQCLRNLSRVRTRCLSTAFHTPRFMRAGLACASCASSLIIRVVVDSPCALVLHCPVPDNRPAWLCTRVCASRLFQHMFCTQP